MNKNERSSQLQLALMTLGVVYGDIGTSPLYAFRESLHATTQGLAHENVLGILSLIFWSIVLVVTVKYVWFVMRADNKGEGGILALQASLLHFLSEENSKLRKTIITLGLFGAALFYGDAIITPAISVLSAVEGLEVVTPRLKPFIIPTTLIILFMLFWYQNRGTQKVGTFFGPIMLLWFIALAVIGLFHIVQYPAVMMAINPLHAILFIYHHGYNSVLTLGAVVLAVTGAEALYADMGHCGAAPIRRMWLYLVFPALLLSYFGQGALVLANPETADNPFYAGVPNWATFALVTLATMATIIASQAVITGAYSLTHQALQLGYLPRIEITHTSESERGQIYLPLINWVLFLAVAGLVISFKSSSALASAYGIAVTGTMLITSILMFYVAKHVWRWSSLKIGIIISLFVTIDLVYFISNSNKFMQGAWFPILMSLLIYFSMSTWRKGRSLLFKKLRSRNTLTVREFLDMLAVEPPVRVSGTAVFMSAPGEGAPHALLHNVRHNKVMHERVIILTIITEDIPFVASEDRFELHHYGDNFDHLTAHFGFTEFPSVPKLLEDAYRIGIQYEPMETSFFLSRLRIVDSTGANMPSWREKLFAFMIKNAAHATDFFKLPNNQVIEFDLRVEI